MLKLYIYAIHKYIQYIVLHAADYEVLPEVFVIGLALKIWCLNIQLYFYEKRKYWSTVVYCIYSTSVGPVCCCTVHTNMHKHTHIPVHAC